MKCVICKHGEVTSGTATVTLERDKTTLVIKVTYAPAAIDSSSRISGRASANATPAR